MPEIPIKVLQDVVKLDELCNIVAKLQKDMRYLLNGQIDFENIRARSIKAENIQVGTLTAEEIAANTITADKMNVNELSAITADLGHITAGLIEAITIIGSEIMTQAAGTYPRTSMSTAGNLFSAEASSANSMTMFADYFGEVILRILGSGVTGQILPQLGKLLIQTALNNGDIQISSGENLDLFAGLSSSHKVRMENWVKLLNKQTNRTLQQDLDGLQNQINSLTNRMNYAEYDLDDLFYRVRELERS